MRKYKAIIYDIDGTLLNTVDQNMYTLIRIIKEELGEDRTFEEVVHFTAYPGLKIIEKLGIRDVEGVYARWVRYVNEYDKGAEPYEGILELLEGAKELGIRQAIVSSKRRRQYGIDMVTPGYDKYMETAVLCEDTEKHKPDPEPLLVCLSRLGVKPEEAIYVGDANTDMEAARNAGMDFVYAAWGSFFPVDPYAPDCYARHPLELLEYLKQ